MLLAGIVGIIMLSFSCNESIDESLHNPYQIDSIVLKSDVVLDLAIRDTQSMDVKIYPSTAEINKEKIEEHQLFLQKKVDGGGKHESSAYMIVDIERLYDNDGKSYRLYIADLGTGIGYKDTVQVCYQNPNSLVESESFGIRNAGSSLFSFSLSDGNTVWSSFGVKNDTIMVQVPSNFNLKDATAYFTHNGSGVYLNDKMQLSGESKCDYTDFCNPPVYIVKGFEGEKRKYTVEVFNLPIIYINTPDSVDITSRYEWLGNSRFIIRDTDGTLEDYGEANVKGRGNWTWREGIRTGKKPYAIKLAKKPKDKTVLGMPGHKRWVLLANPVSYLPNPVGFEVNRRVASCKWAPRSRYVELMLNGKHQGLYLLCEQIKIDKNRVDITEMKETDIDGDAVTGGYLITYDDAYEDDDPTYYSKYYNMPYLLKNPDADEIKPEQLKYISDYINTAELSLFDNEKFLKEDFYNFFDVDSWIDYYFVAELWGALEMQRPRSIWLYKDRDGKLTAGPLWDMESNFFHQQQLYCDTVLYYGRMFECSSVIKRMKNKWGQFRANIIGNENYDGILDYIDSLYNECRYSAERDRKMTPESFYGLLPYEESKIDLEYKVIRDNILVKLDWLERQIMAW